MDIFSELKKAQLEVDNAGLTVDANKVGLIAYKSTTEPMQINDGTQIHKVLTDKMYEEIAENTRAEPNYEISDTSGLAGTSSSTPADITNLSAEITTTGGPVEVTLIHGSSVAGEPLVISARNLSGESASGSIFILKDTTSVYEVTLGSSLASSGSTTNILTIPGSSIRHIDFPAAGTYTYKLQASAASGSTISINNAKLLVREL